MLNPTTNEEPSVWPWKAPRRSPLGPFIQAVGALALATACAQGREANQSPIDGPAPEGGTVAVARWPVECEALSPSDRAECPVVAPVFALVEVPSGVRVQMESEATARLVVAQLRCRSASARSPEVPPHSICPLDVHAVSVRTGGRPDTIEISGGDAASIQAIREYARQEFISTRNSIE